MTELIIHIGADKESLVVELIKQLGGSVQQTNLQVKKAKSKPETKSKETKKKTGNKNNGVKANKKYDHTYLFGKWKDYDIDAKKLREQSW